MKTRQERNQTQQGPTGGAPFPAPPFPRIASPRHYIARFPLRRFQSPIPLIGLAKRRLLPPRLPFLLFSLFFVLLLLAGCGQSGSVKVGASGASQTADRAELTQESGSPGTLPDYTAPTAIDGAGKTLVALYMVGSDLESDEGAAGTKSLKQILAGWRGLSDAEKDKIAVVVAFGGSTKSGWKGMKIANLDQLSRDEKARGFGSDSGEDAYLVRADGANMCHPNTLGYFLRYVRDGYVKHAARVLVFWDHGGAYNGYGTDTNFAKAGLSLDELAAALPKGGRFDVIGFDTCLMASMEVIAMAKSHGRYLLASEENSPGHGWNWTATIQAFARRDGVAAASRAIIDNFVRNDSHGEASTGKTLSLVDMDAGVQDPILARLNAAAKDLSENLARNKHYSQAVIAAVKQSREYGASPKESTRDTVDLKHFAQIVRKNLAAAEARQRLHSLIEALDKAVLYNKEDGTRPNSFGISIIPPDQGLNLEEGKHVSRAWYNLAKAYDDLKKADETAPEATDVALQTTLEYARIGSAAGAEGAALGGAPAAAARPRLPAFLSGERRAFVPMPAQPESTPECIQGMAATFRDDNLAAVTSVFGIQYEDGADAFFLSLGEVEAYATTTEHRYFTPAWNRQWYTVSLDPARTAAWLPLIFQETYETDEGRFTVYAGAVDFREHGKEYSADDPQDDAVLEIVVDEGNRVVDYAIRPYELRGKSPANPDGQIWFSRLTKKLEPGDRVRFYAYAYHRDDPARDAWILASEWLAVRQAPVFGVSALAFADETGRPLDCRYTMKAADIAGHVTLLPPQRQPMGSGL